MNGAVEGLSIITKEYTSCITERVVSQKMFLEDYLLSLLLHFHRSHQRSMLKQTTFCK